MMTAITRVIGGWVLLLGVSAMQLTASAAPGKDPYNHFFYDTFGDFTEELQRAKDEGKEGVFLFFEEDDCPFCHRMKETILNQPDVQAFYRERFLSFAIDIEGDIPVTTFKGKDMAMKDFAEKINRVRATPVLAFYDLSGDQVVKYIGATTDKQEFLWLGEYAAKGIYKEMPFIKYKRQKRQERRN